MGKYDPLMRFLENPGYDTVQMTFSDIERLLGLPLPRSAYLHRPWWANDRSHIQALAWLDAGYFVSGVNLTAETAVFTRTLRFFLRSNEWTPAI